LTLRRWPAVPYSRLSDRQLTVVGGAEAPASPDVGIEPRMESAPTRMNVFDVGPHATCEEDLRRCKVPALCLCNQVSQEGSSPGIHASVPIASRAVAALSIAATGHRRGVSSLQWNRCEEALHDVPAALAPGSKWPRQAADRRPDPAESQFVKGDRFCPPALHEFASDRLVERISEPAIKGQESPSCQLRRRCGGGCRTPS